MDKNRINRRDFLRLSALAFAGTALAACAKATEVQTEAAPTTAEQAAPTEALKPTVGGTMAFWPEWGGKDADALKAQVDKFTQETGIAVDYLPIRDHARMIASISAGEPPDLLMTWDSNAVGSWGFQEALLDLEPYVQAANLKLDNFYDIGLASCKLMGKKLIGLPLTNYLTSVLWYNKDAFKKVGLDPEKPPETWEDVLAADEKMSVVESGQLKTLGYMVMTGQDGHPTLMAYANGGSIWSDDFRKVTPDSDANIAGLKWMQQFYKKYTTAELQRWTTSVAMDESLPSAVLYTGEGGIQISGEWLPSFFEKLDPIPPIGMGWLPYPKDKPEVKGTMTANTNPMVIPSAAKNPDAGFKLIEFISRAENTGPMCVIVGNASPTKDGLQKQLESTTSVAYKYILEQLWTKGNIKSMTINSPIGAEYMDAYSLARDAVLQDLADPVAEMTKVKEDIQPKLDEALAKLGL